MTESTDVKTTREVIEVTEAIAESAKLSLKEIVTSMDFLAEVNVAGFEKNTIYLTIEGDSDAGLLIGKAGGTMKALQQIMTSIMSKKHEGRIYVKVDVNGYWKKREDEIIASALDAAKVAGEEEISVMLEPMNAEERRIIHLSLEDQPNVFSYSEGVGAIKQVVVAHTKFQEERDDN